MKTGGKRRAADSEGKPAAAAGARQMEGGKDGGILSDL